MSLTDPHTLSTPARDAWSGMADAVQLRDHAGCLDAMTFWAGADDDDRAEGVGIALVALYGLLLDTADGVVPDEASIAGWAVEISQRLTPLIPRAEAGPLEQIMLAALGYPADQDSLAGLNLIGLVLALVGELAPRDQTAIETLYAASAETWTDLNSDDAPGG